MIHREDLLGSWHLLSWTLTYPNSSRVELPFGKSPTGLLIYSADGWMSAAISRSERPLLDENSSPRELPARVLANAWPYRLGLMAAALAGIAAGVIVENRGRRKERGT